MRGLHTLRDSEGMNCDVLFLYARDSEQIKDDLLQQLRGVAAHCTCVDDPNFSSQDTSKNFSQIKLQVVFFSPGLLKFLECRGHEAYEYFCNLDPQATVALFCCGLLERMVFCYHTAPLKSYSSWPKYEHMAGQTKGSAFSPYFIGLFQEFLPNKGRTPQSIVIVPELVNKESSSVYIIFSKTVRNVEEISVHIKAGSKIQIAPECINPHVLYFNVPATLLDSNGSFEVRIKQSGRVIAGKDLSVVPATSSKGLRWKNTIERTREMIRLNKKQKAAEDAMSVSFPEDVSNSLPDAYEFGEAHQFSGHPSISQRLSRSYFLKRDSSDSQVNRLEDSDDIDEFPAVCRSVSLPSIMLQQEDCENCYYPDPVYLPMIPIYQHINENFFCQSPSDPSINDSSSYVYMKFGGNSFESAQKDFVANQRELTSMQTFKNGTNCSTKENTRIRRQKPVESPNSSGNDERGEMTFAREGRRRGARFSKLQQQTTDTDAEMSSKRNSASSSSSKTSGMSNSTVQSWRYDESPKANDEDPTNEFSNYPTPRMRPVSNGGKPVLRNEDSSLYRTRYPNRKNRPSKPIRFSDRQSTRRDSDDNEKVESLIKVCERYGLQHLGDYFISGCPDNADALKDDRLPGTEGQDQFNIERFQISDDWDQDNNLSLRRSYSLPSTLFPTEPVVLLEENLDLDGGYDDVRYPDDDDETNDSTSCSCGDYINTYSGVYMSLMLERSKDEPENLGCPVNTLKSLGDNCSYASGIYMSLIPINPSENVINHSLQSCSVSNSQKELLELMEAYKRGDKTISQVEQQFQQWHNRHMATPSSRDQHLLHLRDEYVRAQKTGKSRFIELILRKPKPGRKDNKKSTDGNERTVKKKVGKSNSDSKRLSKASTASPSSGSTSENGDVFKWCYANPSYGGTQNFRRGNNFKPFCSPPPLPPRPTLAPISILRAHIFAEQAQSEVSKHPKTPTNSQADSSQQVKQKPSPPPKPPDVLKKLKCNRQGDGNENNPNKQGKPTSENEDNRPGSPDYIIPNPVRRDLFRRRYQQMKPNPACPLHYPVPAVQFPPKQNGKPSSCPSTLTGSRNHSKDSTKSMSRNHQLKDAIPNPFAGLATQLRPKKTEMSKFYVTRKWSSFPKLDNLDIHTYLDLQELFDNRNRSISDSSNPVD